MNQNCLKRNARDALSVILHASWVSQTIQELFVYRSKGIKTMPKCFDLTEGTKWQWFISFDDFINLWKRWKLFKVWKPMSVRIMEIYRISAAFDEFLNLQLSPLSLKFKGNIELRAIWMLKVLWRIPKHKMSVSIKNITVHCPRISHNWEENVIFPPKLPQIFRESLILNGNVFSRHSLLESR